MEVECGCNTTKSNVPALAFSCVVDDVVTPAAKKARLSAVEKRQAPTPNVTRSIGEYDGDGGIKELTYECEELLKLLEAKRKPEHQVVTSNAAIDEIMEDIILKYVVDNDGTSPLPSLQKLPQAENCGINNEGIWFVTYPCGREDVLKLNDREEELEGFEKLVKHLLKVGRTDVLTDPRVVLPRRIVNLVSPPKIKEEMSFSGSRSLNFHLLRRVPGKDLEKVLAGLARSGERTELLRQYNEWRKRFQDETYLVHGDTFDLHNILCDYEKESGPPRFTMVDCGSLANYGRFAPQLAKALDDNFTKMVEMIGRDDWCGWIPQ